MWIVCTYVCMYILSMYVHTQALHWTTITATITMTTTKTKQEKETRQVKLWLSGIKNPVNPD